MQENIILSQQVQSITDVEPYLPGAQFIPVAIEPEKDNLYYCIEIYRCPRTKYQKTSRNVVEFVQGRWICKNGWQVQYWLCEDEEFIDKVNGTKQ